MDRSVNSTSSGGWTPASQNARKREANKTLGLARHGVLENPLVPFPDPYVRRPALVYAQNLLPLFSVIGFSFAFAIYIHRKGEVPVPRWLFQFTTSNPRLTAQIVTIFSSSLTAAARWALSGSATLLATKRIANRPRPILEIELFSSLKHISVVWGWRYKKRMMLLTSFLVTLCGLLTSGFVTLFNPLPVSIVTQLSGGKELNLASNSSRCTEWYTQIREYLREKCIWYYQGFEYSSCSASQVDILDVVKASLRQRASQDPLGKHDKLASVYSELNSTWILGTTAGTLITGPDGIQVFDLPTPLPTSANYNYTLKLQSTQAGVSCSNDRTSALNVEWGAVHNGSKIEYKISCPNSSSYEIGNTTVTYETLVNFEVARICSMENGEKAILFRFFPTILESWNAGTDYLSCRFPARLDDIEMLLDADLRAFVPMKKGSSVPAAGGIADMAVEDILQMVSFHFNDLETKQKLWSDRFLFQGRKDDIHDMEVVASAMQGMFEYEATRLRLMLTATSMSDTLFTMPEECAREVEAATLERTVGWSIQQSTILGLVPLVLVTLTSLAMCVLAWATAGRLTLFDPTNPVSLIAATSLGHVVFPEGRHGIKSFGDPIDETLLFTRVSYREHGGSWGLKSV